MTTLRIESQWPECADLTMILRNLRRTSGQMHECWLATLKCHALVHGCAVVREAEPLPHFQGVKQRAEVATQAEIVIP